MIRVAYVAETSEVPLVRHLIGDAAGYYEWAGRIADGEWFGKEPFYQAPLYPYVLGVYMTVCGESVWAVRLLQGMWGGLAVWCLWYGTREVLGHRAALVAAAMLTCYAPAVFFDGALQKASLGCLLVCGLVAAMGAFRGRADTWRAALVGGVVGLVVLTRENALVWVPVLGLWVWLSGRSRATRARGGGLGAYAVGLALVLAPVGVRNKMVGGEWSVSTFQSGANFYIGNHRGSDGRYAPLVRGHESPAFERRDAAALAERDLGRRLSPREVSDYWWSRALGDIGADPGWWFGLMGRKLLMVVNRFEVSDVESQYIYEEYSVILRVLGSVWHFGVLCPLAVIGVVATRGHWRRLWVYHAMIFSMAFAVALFYVMARYRFPLVPLLIPFAAAGSLELWRLMRRREFRTLAWRGIVVLTVAGVVNFPIHDEGRLNALAWMNVGVALAGEGDVAGATVYFRRAVAGHRTSAEANNNLAQALALQGDYGGAIPHYQASLAADATLPGADYNLAVALERVGRTAEAIRHYKRAVDLNPSDAESRAALARLGRPSQR